MHARDGEMIPPPKSKLGIGVSWDPKRGGKHYKARIYVRSKELNVGRFATPLEAQLAHDQAVSLLPPDEQRPSNFPHGRQGRPYNNADVERRVRSFLERVPAGRPSRARPAARLAPPPAAAAASPTDPSDASGSDVAVLLRDQQQGPWLPGNAAWAAAAGPAPARAAPAHIAMPSGRPAAAVAHSALPYQQPLQRSAGVPWQSAGVPLQPVGVVPPQPQPTPAGPRGAHFVFFPDQLEEQLQQQLQQQQQELQEHQQQLQQELQQRLQRQHNQLQLQHQQLEQQRQQLQQLAQHRQQLQQLEQQRQQLQQLEQQRALMHSYQQQQQDGVRGQQPLSQPRQPQPQQQQARPVAPAKTQPTDQQVQQVLKLVMQLVRQP